MRLWLIPLLLVSSAFGVTSYSTTFSATENPICEGGKWANGKTAGSGACAGIAGGLDWTDIRTTANTKAFGTNTGTNPGFNDSTAVLQGIGGWGSNQSATGVVFLSSVTNGDDEEIEIRLNTTIAAHNITGYECNYSTKNDGTQYSSIVKWLGAEGSFTRIAGPATGIHQLTNGDTFSCQNIGGTITSYINGVVVNSVHDTTYTGGSPGIGTDSDNGGGADNANFGFSSFSATDSSTGGTCPAGANYLNTSTNTLVTLSSLGVNSCYYIAANGSDSNDGLSEAGGHPWLHAPNMPNCTANCKIVANTCNANHCGGFGFVFRGGDTWHFGNTTDSAGQPAMGGTWNWAAGLPSSTVYLGVDQSWFAGGSWVKPIFNGDNPVCGPSNVGGNCHSTTIGSPAYNQPQYYVTSCIANPTFVATSGSSHYTFDNFEITGLCDQLVSGKSSYFVYGSSGDMRFQNLYIHGWSHLQYADVNADCETRGILCPPLFIFQGGKSNTPDDTFRYVVVDGADSDPMEGQTCYCDFWDVAYSYFGKHGGAVTRFQHIYHDNLYENWYENGHGNMMESVGDAPGTNAFYNNVFRHINTPGDPGDPGYWFFPPPGTTLYFFNNLTYDVTKMEYYNIAQNSGLPGGTQVVFDNTFQNNVVSGGGIFDCNGNGTYTFTGFNNHYITEGGNAFSGGNCGSASDTTSLLMNNATATADGYTNAQTFAYSPINNSVPTVQTGTNKQSLCSALLTAGLNSAASACQNDTTYACSYNSSTHVITCPARTSLSRPGSSAWDKGSFQFNNAPPQSIAPSCAPGTGNYTTTQTVTCTNTNPGTTVMCYRTDGGAPATSGDGINCAVGSTKYTTTISVSSNETLSIIAGTSIATDSVVVSYIYTFNVALPTFSPTAGHFSIPQTITITSQPGAVECVTTDGTTPTAPTPGTCQHGATIANGGTVSVSTSQTLNALGTEAGLSNSAVATAAYTIGGLVYIPNNCSFIGNTSGAGNVQTFNCVPAQVNDAIAIFVSCHQSTAGTPSSVSMSAAGWSFTALSGLVGTGSGLVGQIFGTIAPTNLSTTFTATWVGVTNCTSNRLVVSGEFAGNSTAGGATTFNATGTSGGNNASGCSQSAANVTPSLSNEAVWVACLDSATAVLSPWSQGVTDFNGDFGEYQILSGGAGVAQTPAFTSSGGYIVEGVAIAPLGSTPTAATPTFSPVAGTYTSEQSVVLSTTSGGTVICYNTTGNPATNGSTGCTAGTLYTGPVPVLKTETLSAVAGGTGYLDSSVGSAVYTINIPPGPGIGLNIGIGANVGISHP